MLHERLSDIGKAAHRRLQRSPWVSKCSGARLQSLKIRKRNKDSLRKRQDEGGGGYISSREGAALSSLTD